MRNDRQPENQKTPEQARNLGQMGVSQMQNHFASETVANVRMLPIGDVSAIAQVRTVFKERSIEELAADIKEHGLLQPIVVRKSDSKRIDGTPMWTVIIGERRLRALQLIKAEFVPAIVAEEKIDATTLTEIQLTENLQREDLSVKDLAATVHQLWTKHKSLAGVAKKIGKSKSWVSKRLALALNLPPLTTELLDTHQRDVELLYAFRVLETTDAQAARDLLPALIDGDASREDVQHALKIATGKIIAEPERAPDLIDAMEEGSKPPADKRLAITIEALRKIANEGRQISMTGNPTERDIAIGALREIGAL